MLAALLFSSVIAFANPEILEVDIITYQDLSEDVPEALYTLNTALHEKGIVGIKGIPGYQEKVQAFIKQAQLFTSLPEQVKNRYAPNHDLGEIFLGYEAGKEKFKRPDGTWVIDDLKVSFYAFAPDCPLNKWPVEMDLKTPYQDLAILMAEMGKSVMGKIGLIGTTTGIDIQDTPACGRMLYYRKNTETSADNPFWCGAHFDHGLFTALLPAFYFMDGKPVAEPIEAGLFVKTHKEGIFKKVISDDPDVLLFQVGEFGQLITNDRIQATEHCVRKAHESIERYTMALFLNVPMDTIVHSSSVLTADSRYEGGVGSPCSFLKWNENSFNRYIVNEK